MKVEYTKGDFVKDVIFVVFFAAVFGAILGIITGCASEPSRRSASEVAEQFAEPKNSVERCVVLIDEVCSFNHRCNLMPYQECMMTNLTITRCNDLATVPDIITEKEFETCIEAMHKTMTCASRVMPPVCNGIIEDQEVPVEPLPKENTVPQIDANLLLGL